MFFLAACIALVKIDAVLNKAPASQQKNSDLCAAISRHNKRKIMKKKTFKSTGNPKWEAALTSMDNTMSLKNQAHATRVNYIRGVRDLIINLHKLPETYPNIKNLQQKKRNKSNSFLFSLKI